MKFIGIDLFAGAGGTTTGITMAKYNGKCIAEVIAAINHDKYAIESHAANYPESEHYEEDIKTFNLDKLPKINKDKDDIIFIWASLECTNFSNAKGGLPRDADSRTLAEHLFRYIEYVNPDYILIENVREFMSWGALDENGKPINREKGKDYIKWVKNIKKYGYMYDFRLLNSADYGAYTSRLRYFGIFAKEGFPISFPEPTYSKNGNLFDSQKWKSVKDCLDLGEIGTSIFRDKKPLCEKTYKRIFAGLNKFVKNPFIIKYLSNNAKTGVNNGVDINNPLCTITTQNRLGIIQPKFIVKYYKTGENVNSLDNPASTLTTKDRLGLVFIQNYYTSGGINSSINAPCGSLLSNPKQRLIQTEQFIAEQNYNNVGQDLNKPLKTILACRKYPYLITIDKLPENVPTFVKQNEEGAYIEIYEQDSEYVKKIKQFMAANGIVNIYMRMLNVNELLKIQGFPDDYKLLGNQTQKKKFIGNSVVPVVVAKWFEALYEANLKKENIAA